MVVPTFSSSVRISLQMLSSPLTLMQSGRSTCGGMRVSDASAYVGQGRGEEKKQYVLDFLKQKGFKVDEESVVNAIEAIVKQLNTEGLTIE